MRALLLLPFLLLAASPALAARCAKVLNSTVINIVQTNCSVDPHDGTLMIPSTTANIGDTYANGAFLAPVSGPQTTALTFLQFMALFTPAEQSAIVSATDPQIRLFTLMAASSPSIDLTNAEVITGVQYLVAVNLLTSARASTILSGAAP